MNQRVDNHFHHTGHKLRAGVIHRVFSFCSVLFDRELHAPAGQRIFRITRSFSDRETGSKVLVKQSVRAHGNRFAEQITAQIFADSICHQPSERFSFDWDIRQIQAADNGVE